MYSEARDINLLYLISIPLGVLLYALAWIVYETWGRKTTSAFDVYYTFSFTVGKPMFWIGVVPICVFSLLPGVVMKFYQRRFRPDLASVLQEAFNLGYHKDENGNYRTTMQVVDSYVEGATGKVDIPAAEP